LSPLPLLRIQLLNSDESVGGVQDLQHGDGSFNTDTGVISIGGEPLVQSRASSEVVRRRDAQSTSPMLRATISAVLIRASSSALRRLRHS
jgi:hypothetical protein